MQLKEAYHSTRHSMTDLAHSMLFGRPDVIIMGEKHTDEGHATDQARMIRRHKPEYVLSEGLDGLDPADTQNLIKIYETATLGELSRKSGIKPEEMGISEDALLKVKEDITRANERATQSYRDSGLSGRKAKKLARKAAKDGIVPGTYKQVLKTPFYELNDEVLGTFGDMISRKCDSYTSQEKYDLAKKMIAIEKHLYGFRECGVCGDRGQGRVYHAISKTGASLAGCDIDKKLPQLNLSEESEKLSDDEKIKNILEHLASLGEYAEENNAPREQEMGRRIAQYTGKRKTQTPVIAIVGKEHTRKDSGIYPVLDEAGVNYRIVRQKALKGDNLKSLLYPVQLGTRN